MQDPFWIYDNDKILAYLFKIRYSLDTYLFICNKCGQKCLFMYPVLKRKVFSTGCCGYHVSPLAGTIFHKSDTPLTVWLQAIYLMVNSKGKIPATEIQRQLKVTYKTAWRFKQLIRPYIHSRDILKAIMLNNPNY